MDQKRCPACNRTLPMDAFHRARARKDGRQTECIQCARKRRVRYGEMHPEKVKAANRRQYVKRAEWARAYAKEWRRQNPERVKERTRAYRAAHPGWQQSVYRQWREANPDYWKRWNKINADKRRVYLLKRRRAVAAVAIVPFSPKQLEQRLSMFPGCWMCGKSADCIDHVKPIAKGGLHVLSNLRPACVKCNNRKRDHWPLSA